jgi:hypothetical protein
VISLSAHVLWNSELGLKVSHAVTLELYLYFIFFLQNVLLGKPHSVLQGLTDATEAGRGGQRRISKVLSAV